MWPSGLRRNVKAVVLIGGGSNPLDVIFYLFVVATRQPNYCIILSFYRICIRRTIQIIVNRCYMMTSLCHCSGCALEWYDSRSVEKYGDYHVVPAVSNNITRTIMPITSIRKNVKDAELSCSQQYK